MAEAERVELPQLISKSSRFSRPISAPAMRASTYKMVIANGFEPLRRIPSPDLQSGAFSQTQPHYHTKMESVTGFEPVLVGFAIP